MAYGQVTVTTFATRNSTVVGTMKYYKYGITGSYTEQRIVATRYNSTTGSYEPVYETVTIPTYGPVEAGSVTKTATAKTSTYWYDPDGSGPMAPQQTIIYTGHEATFPSPNEGDWIGGVSWTISSEA